MSKRLSVFLPNLSGGGAERNILLIAGEMYRFGWETDLVVASFTGALTNRVPDTVTHTDLGRRHVSTASSGLARYLRARRPHAVLSALTHANIVAALAKRIAAPQARLVVSERNHLSSDLPDRALLRLAYPHLIRLTYGWADRVIAVTGGVANDLAGRFGVPQECIVVEPNPLPREAISTRAEEALSHPWASDSGDPIVLGVGRLTAQKDFETLIRAVSLTHLKCRLALVGDGECRLMLERLSKELGVADRVLFVGFAENPYPWFRIANVFCLSSRYEGLPTALLEGMSLGLPVVATDCPTGPRELLANGELGILVQIGDAEAMAAGIDATLKVGRAHINYPGLDARDLHTVASRYSAHLDGSYERGW
jgi:glycosyltransferase involved in cell wall biosynthesis